MPNFAGGHGVIRCDRLDFKPALAQVRPDRRNARMSGPRTKPPKRQQVYTLLVEIGRKAGDGLPEKATGAALMVYASGVDEEEAVRETVAVLKQADTAPLDVSGYGTLDERLAEGHDISDDERSLMARALEENAVIVAQVTPFYD
jgi:hypothetical protein